MKRWTIIFAIAAALLFIRVDIWSWGQVTPVVLFGWLSTAELYQLFILAAGYLLLVVGVMSDSKD